MKHDPSAGQPRKSGRYSHRTSKESGIGLGAREPFPVGARVAGNGTIGFVKGGKRPAGHIPVDEGGSMTVFIKERDLTNLDELMDDVMPALEGVYAPEDAFDAYGAHQAMTILRQLAQDRADRAGHKAYVEAMCALGWHDSIPMDFESAAAMLAGSDNLPARPDVCTPKRASRLARHFTEKAAEKARDHQLVDAALYADVAVIFAGGPEAAGTKDRIFMASRLRAGSDTPDEFLTAVFSGEFDTRYEKPHTYKA